MHTYLDCIPCILNQALRTIRLQTTDEKVHETALKQAMQQLLEADWNDSPPVLSGGIQSLLVEITGQPDPFRQINIEVEGELVDSPLVLDTEQLAVAVVTTKTTADAVLDIVISQENSVPGIRGIEIYPAAPVVPEQAFNVFLDELMVHAYQWADGVDVSLTVQHPDGVGGWDPAFHSETLPSGDAPWNPGSGELGV